MISGNIELAKLGPIEHVCSVSIKPDSSWVLGNSLLSTFNEIPVPFDLKHTIDELVTQGRQRKEELSASQETHSVIPYVYIDILLGACAEAGKVEVLKRADVVLWRGVLRQCVAVDFLLSKTNTLTLLASIMMGQKISLLVSLINGTLFVEQKDTESVLSAAIMTRTRILD